MKRHGGPGGMYSKTARRRPAVDFQWGTGVSSGRGELGVGQRWAAAMQSCHAEPLAPALPSVTGRACCRLMFDWKPPWRRECSHYHGALFSRPRRAATLQSGFTDSIIDHNADSARTQAADELTVRRLGHSCMPCRRRTELQGPIGEIAAPLALTAQALSSNTAATADRRSPHHSCRIAWSLPISWTARA
jgi:hypothetical protein